MVRLGLMYIRLPIGTTISPVEYARIRKTEVDLGNDLLMDTSIEFLELQYPHGHLLPKEEYLPNSMLLVPADTLTVVIEAQGYSVEGFRNVIITPNIDDPNWV